MLYAHFNNFSGMQGPIPGLVNEPVLSSEDKAIFKRENMQSDLGLFNLIFCCWSVNMINVCI